MIKQGSRQVPGYSATKEAEQQCPAWSRRKAAGLCVSCGTAPPAIQRIRCDPCLAKLRNDAKERTARRKVLGQCVQCGKPKAEGIQHCRVCRPLEEQTLARRRAAAVRQSTARQRRQAAAQRQSCARELVRAHLHLLTPRQREVMILRTGLNGDKPCSGLKVGRLLGVSRQAVSAVEAAAWRRIERAQAQ
jgi:hypothetical protein